MLFDIATISVDFAWPLILFMAWLVGEYMHRHIRLPRISVYAAIGFGSASLGLVSQPPSEAMLLLANIAFGLILFEAGYRINLHWLRLNPWLGISSLAEATITFAVVYGLGLFFDFSVTSSVLLAALAMATSPATMVRVVNEQRAAGQVTERILHLSVLNCVLAVLVFNIVVGLQVLQTSGSVFQAIDSSLLTLSVSMLLGALFGFVVPVLLRKTYSAEQNATLAFALALMLLVGLTHSLRLSPVLAALTFGLIARHRRMVLSPSQRGFGVLGEMLSLLLFVFVSSTLDWPRVIDGMGIGLALIGVRLLAKGLGIGLFAHLSGISWRKGIWTSLAMAPISAFVILLLEQTRYLGLELLDQLAPLAAAALVLEILGPILTLRALVWAKEVPDKQEGK